MTEEPKSLTIAEDNHPINQELSFLDELVFIVANEPHAKK